MSSQSVFSRVYDGHFQVNNHSFSTFANTISFNISRYPTPVEITDSKDYQGPGKPSQSSDKQNGVENGVKRTEEAEVALTTSLLRRALSVVGVRAQARL